MAKKFVVKKVGADFTDYAEIDLKKVPMHMRVDFHTRNENVKSLRTLCERCNGTGNELFSMFRECTACGGKGHK